MNARLSRSAQLLEMLMRNGVLSEDELARQLVVSRKTLDGYRSGTIPMPLERQLCLALLMTTLPGKYARQGYALREQVRAATRYELRMTGADDVSPARA